MSLRSKTRVNVAGIARTLHEGGGGHVRAAGCRVPTSLDALMTRLPGVLEDGSLAQSLPGSTDLFQATAMS